MKKILAYIFTTVLALCIYMPGFNNCVEAAEMIVLPVINNVDYPEIESTYYDNVLDCVKQQDRYNYIDPEEGDVAKIVEKYTVKGKLPDEAALRGIAEAANVDLVVAIELNKLNYTPRIATREDFYILDLKGNTVSYNREENKFEKRKLYIEEEVDNGFYTRQNVQLRYWARTVQREMHRVMKYKGLGLQKQKIQKF